jgi:hypothetical protein
VSGADDREDPVLNEALERANARDGSRPSPATVAAILAHARMSAAHARHARHRWRGLSYAAAAAVAVLIAFPLYREHPLVMQETRFEDQRRLAAGDGIQSGDSARAGAASEREAPARAPAAPAAGPALTRVPVRAPVAMNAPAPRAELSFQASRTSPAAQSPAADAREAAPAEATGAAVGVDTRNLARIARSAPAAGAAPAADVDEAPVAGVRAEGGAAVDARDAQGRTALLRAVVAGRVDHVKLLLQRGADPTVADASGRTPLALALAEGREDIADALRRAGAR